MLHDDTLVYILSLTSILSQIQGQICISEGSLIDEFNAISIQYNLSGENGSPCHIDKYDHDHDHNHSHEHSNSTCQTVYDVCRTVILNLDLTTEECLEEHNHSNETSSEGVSSAKAYGYGFLMVFFISICSLGGVFLVPLLTNNSENVKRVYEYVYSFMIALAISTLVADAVLHLIPHAFGLHVHEHEDEDDDHDHGSERSTDHLDIVWKGSLVLLGLYGFYLLEFFLHKFGHDHSDSEPMNLLEDRKKAANYGTSDHKPDSTTNLTEPKNDFATSSPNRSKICVHPKKIKTVAWLVIVGDSVHNIADGIALGAAISQSLSLGVSTMIAIAFHELPHELGDFVILVKSGFHWSIALLINFTQSVGAVFGLFIGVAVSNHSEGASDWILAITAGLFLYISLTDLLPDLVHGGKHEGVKVKQLLGSSCSMEENVRFVLINLGFYVGFVILVLLAIYEEELNLLF